jgi:hypothetical protein
VFVPNPKPNFAVLLLLLLLLEPTPLPPNKVEGTLGGVSRPVGGVRFPGDKVLFKAPIVAPPKREADGDANPFVKPIPLTLFKLELPLNGDTAPPPLRPRDCPNGVEDLLLLLVFANGDVLTL